MGLPEFGGMPLYLASGANLSRAQRLLDLIQLLRQHRRPVTGAMLAQELGISVRTLYRDIDALKAQGALIDGEAGLGYVLRPGFMLPPLMFTEDELEALILGSGWVSQRTDDPLGRAARNALAKIAAVLPNDLQQKRAASALMIGPADINPAPGVDLPILRAAIRGERKLQIAYLGADGKATDRVIWPIALAFFERARIVVAWCELRRDFRHFRTDRITGIRPLEIRYAKRRAALLKEWRTKEGIPPAHY
jgi:predicted DNA-binding transcriptional regulator YafY